MAAATRYANDAFLSPTVFFSLLFIPLTRPQVLSLGSTQDANIRSSTIRSSTTYTNSHNLLIIFALIWVIIFRTISSCTDEVGFCSMQETTWLLLRPRNAKFWSFPLPSPVSLKLRSTRYFIADTRASVSVSRLVENLHTKICYKLFPPK